jgi:hypothetical protein
MLYMTGFFQYLGDGKLLDARLLVAGCPFIKGGL